MALKHAKRFVEFHKKNPDVWKLFDRFAREAIAAGHTRFSADMIVHRIRWETSVVTRGAGWAGGHPLKINDHFVAYYARLWMLKNPSYGAFFATRTVSKSIPSPASAAASAAASGATST